MDALEKMLSKYIEDCKSYKEVDRRIEELATLLTEHLAANKGLLREAVVKSLKSMPRDS